MTSLLSLLPGICEVRHARVRAARPGWNVPASPQAPRVRASALWEFVLQAVARLEASLRPGLRRLSAPPPRGTPCTACGPVHVEDHPACWTPSSGCAACWGRSVECSLLRGGFLQCVSLTLKTPTSSVCVILGCHHSGRQVLDSGEWRLFLECHVLHSALHRLWTRGPEAVVSQGLPLLRVRGPERTGSHAPLALCPCPAPLPGPGPCPSPLQLTKETALSPTNCPSSPQTLASFSPPPGHVSPSAPHVLSSGSHWGPLSRTLHFSPGKAEGTCLGPCLAQSGHRQPTPWDEHTQARLPVQLAAMEGNFGRFLGRKWCHPVPEMLSPNEETAIPHLRGWPANH